MLDVHQLQCDGRASLSDDGRSLLLEAASDVGVLLANVIPQITSNVTEALGREPTALELQASAFAVCGEAFTRIAHGVRAAGGTDDDVVEIVQAARDMLATVVRDQLH